MRIGSSHCKLKASHFFIHNLYIKHLNAYNGLTFLYSILLLRTQILHCCHKQHTLHALRADSSSLKREVCFNTICLKKHLICHSCEHDNGPFGLIICGKFRG